MHSSGNVPIHLDGHKIGEGVRVYLDELAATRPATMPPMKDEYFRSGFVRGYISGVEDTLAAIAPLLDEGLRSHVEILLRRIDEDGLGGMEALEDLRGLIDP